MQFDSCAVVLALILILILALRGLPFLQVDGGKPEVTPQPQPQPKLKF